jgi:hypothetical protein
MVKVVCPKVRQHRLADLLAVVLPGGVGEPMMPKDNVSGLSMALYGFYLCDHFFQFRQVSIAMGNTFVSRQMWVIGYARLVVA